MCECVPARHTHTTEGIDSATNTDERTNTCARTPNPEWLTANNGQTNKCARTHIAFASHHQQSHGVWWWDTRFCPNENRSIVERIMLNKNREGEREQKQQQLYLCVRHATQCTKRKTCLLPMVHGRPVEKRQTVVADAWLSVYILPRWSKYIFSNAIFVMLTGDVYV